MNKQKSAYRLALLLLLSAILPSSLSALTKDDVHVKDSEIVQARCTPSKKQFPVSLQAATLYEMKYEGILPATRTRYFVSAICGRRKATAYYYEYANNAKARSALAFVRAKIWGGYSRTTRHPERIYIFNNYLIVVSSPGSRHVLDQLIRVRVSNAAMDDVTLSKIIGRLKCYAGGPHKSVCAALKLFKASPRGEFTRVGYRFGRAWEIALNGRTRSLYDVAYVGPASGNGKRMGFISPINPDNPGEEKMLSTLHENLKAGRPAKLAPPLAKFLESIRTRFSQPIRSLKSAHLMKAGRLTFHVRTVDGKIIFLSTTEHITGFASGIIIGVLRPIR